MRPSALFSLLVVLPAFAEYAEVNGLRMYYEVHGQGRPLVLLHSGLNTIRNSFSKQSPVLAKNHRVIAIEQMAHGHTPDIPGRELSYEGMAEDTAALLRHLEIRNADLVGWSDGGEVALRLAFTHPELVRRVVVSGVGLGPTPAMLKEFADAAAFAAWFPENRAEYARVSPDGPEHSSAFAEKVRALWSRPTWGISEAELAKINLPVMLVAGDRDVIRIEETARIFRAIPNASACTFSRGPAMRRFRIARSG